MTPPTSKPNGRPVPPPDLRELVGGPLSAEAEARLAEKAAESMGSPAWKRRKSEEARSLLALAEHAPRLTVREIDLRTDLLAIVELAETPVPVRAPDSKAVTLSIGAALAIRYPEAILTGPIPGTQPVRVVAPLHIFHSNVAYGMPMPPLCLGPNVPRGFPVRELVLMAYGALTLQTVSLDVFDPAGVMNPEAATFYQREVMALPLTREPFLSDRPFAPMAGGEA